MNSVQVQTDIDHSICEVYEQARQKKDQLLEEWEQLSAKPDH